MSGPKMQMMQVTVNVTQHILFHETHYASDGSLEMKKNNKKKK